MANRDTEPDLAGETTDEQDGADQTSRLRTTSDEDPSWRGDERLVPPPEAEAP